jgi:formylglycine-generating enzyme required for sulfatase activity
MVVQPTRLEVYVNNVSAANLSARSKEEFDTPLELAVNVYDRFNQRWVGSMDEVRVSRASRSAAWLRASWLTVAQHPVFTKYGLVEANRDLTSVPGADGAGVAYDFLVSVREVSVADYVAFLNAQTNGQISVSAGRVLLAATSDLLCLTPEAEPSAYVAYDAGRNPGERFAAVSGRAGHPMIFVSWFGAAAYCNWKSGQQGLTPVYDPMSGWSAALGNTGYRLPTEAEWYKAAAWDKTTAAFKTYGTGRDVLVAADANYLNSGDPSEINTVKTTETGSYALSSPYLVKDASGNVWEWCHGFYGPGGSNPAADVHALRGGSWCNLASGLKTAVRSGLKPGMAVNSVGFRIVTTADVQ